MMQQLHSAMRWMVILFITLTPLLAKAGTRTLETRFALSADARSEFTTRFPVLSVGRILIEVNWSPSTSATTGLTIMLSRPDGSTATIKNGTSSLRCDYRATEQDIENFASQSPTKWTLKIFNDENNRSEIAGTVRITLPVEIRTLEDTQFTLLGSGNAQEISFIVPAPGRLEVQTSWDGLENKSSVILTVSLLHPAESRTYARRRGTSPVAVDQQVSEEALDRGSRWVVRVQNDTLEKVSGRVRINYTPGF
jgi:hypothetical protein